MLSTELKTQIGHHKEFKADVSSVSPSSIANGKGLTLETSAFTEANLRFQLS